jgi:hypothetical protein
MAYSFEKEEVFMPFPSTFTRALRSFVFSLWYHSIESSNISSQIHFAAMPK